MPKKKHGRADYGGGSIYPTANGRFIVAVRLQKGGKPIRRRAATSEEAERIKAELLALRSSGVKVDMALAPFEVYANWWYNHVYLQKEPAERTQQHTIDMIQWYILPTIGKAALSTIEHEQLQSLLNNLRHSKGARKGKPLAPQTKGHVARLLKQMFHKAFKANYIPRDPSEDLIIPKIDKTPKEAPTVEQVRRLLSTVEGHSHELAYHLMATLGLRLGEALALRRIDFNEDFTEVKIETAISYRTLAIGEPKRGSKRPLPVPPRLAALCQIQWRRVLGTKQEAPAGWNALGYMLPSEAGTAIQPSNFEKSWNGYTQRRGGKEYRHTGFKQRANFPAEMTLHSLRAFVATTLEDVDAPQRTIGHILGHGAKNVTEKYIKRRIPTMRRALEKLEQMLWSEQEAKEMTG